MFRQNSEKFRIPIILPVFENRNRKSELATKTWDGIEPPSHYNHIVALLILQLTRVYTYWVYEHYLDPYSTVFSSYLQSSWLLRYD